MAKYENLINRMLNLIKFKNENKLTDDYVKGKIEELADHANDLKACMSDCPEFETIQKNTIILNPELDGILK